MDFEAKAREVCRALGASAPRLEAVALVADSLRAAALDDDARHEARAELTRLLAEVKARAHGPPLTFHVGEAASWDAPPQPTPLADIEAIDAAISANILNPGTALTSSPRLVHLLERLLWLLGLSEGERRFVAALADDAADFDMAQVYADWLEDDGRTAAGARVRRLAPRDGDVMVLHYREGAYEEHDVLKVLSAVEGYLKARGVDILVLALHDHDDLTALDPEAMRAAGWVRAEDAERAVAAAIRASLPDDSDPEAADPEAGVVTFHFATPRGTPPGSAPEAPP